MEKLTAEELKTLQDAYSKKLNLESKLGQAYMQQQMIASEAQKAAIELKAVQDKLLVTYGDVQIDITTGELTEIAADS